MSPTIYPPEVVERAAAIFAEKCPNVAADRRFTAAQVTVQRGVQPTDGTWPEATLFVVQSDRAADRVYVVDTVRRTCGCSDFRTSRKGKPCKHLIAVSLACIMRRQLHFSPLIEPAPIAAQPDPQPRDPAAVARGRAAVAEMWDVPAAALAIPAAPDRTPIDPTFEARLAEADWQDMVDSLGYEGTF